MTIDVLTAPDAAPYLFVTLTVVVTVAAAIRGIWSPCGLSMISAINPFTEFGRGNRYRLTAAWFVAGSVVGGALLGGVAAIGAAAWSLPAGQHVLSAAVGSALCLVAAASDTSATGFRLPEHPRQVNERWLGRYRRWVYASGFGLQIGAGFATYIMTAAVYLTVALGVLSGSPAFAVAVGVLFGLVRGLAVLLSSGAKDPASLRRLHRALDRYAPWSLRAAIAAELIAALGLGYAGAGMVGLAVVAVLVGAGSRRARRRARRRAGTVWAAGDRTSAATTAH